MAKTSATTPAVMPSKCTAKALTDDLTNEVSINAYIDASGLSLSGRSRLLSAADKLFGGIAGLPAAYVWDFLQRKEMELTIRRESKRIEGARALEFLSEMDTLGQATAHRLIESERRKQSNIESVWLRTIDASRTLPQPATEQNSDTQNSLDEDWMNIFVGYAENASSERLRTFWGRVLAGEVRKPGSFSLATMRIMAELDADIAAWFQEAVTLRIEPCFIIRPTNLAGPRFLQLTALEEAGLLQEVSGALAITSSENNGREDLYRAGNFILRFEQPGGNKVRQLGVIKISRVGMQISAILPRDELASLRLVAGLVDPGTGMEIRDLTQNDNQYTKTTPVKSFPARRLHFPRAE